MSLFQGSPSGIRVRLQFTQMRHFRARCSLLACFIRPLHRDFPLFAIPCPRSLEALLEDLRDGAAPLIAALARGPPAACGLHDAGLLRLFAALNRTVAPLFAGRQRAPFLEELAPPPQRADGAFDAEFLTPWMEMARKAIGKVRPLAHDSCRVSRP